MADQRLLERMKELLDETIYELYSLEFKDPQKERMTACFSYSRCAQAILKALGYRDATVIRVCIMCGNEIGRRIFLEQAKTGKFDRDELVKAGGWNIGIGVPPDFHYVVYFTETAEILDLTYGNANRPEYNLEAKAFWGSPSQYPESIVFIDVLCDGVPIRNFNPLWDYPNLRNRFRKAIKRIIKQLKKEGYAANNA